MGKKIIVADDNRTFLMYLGLLLKRFDFEVLTAEDGMDVLRLIKLVGADLVLLDVHMKQMDGPTVLRHIRKEKTMSHIPVIMASVDTTDEAMAACKKLGCFAYLKKPVKINILYDTIQRCFFSYRGTNRKVLRAHLHQKITLKHKGTQYELYTETLSERGLYIIKESPLPVDSEVELALPVRDYILPLRGTVIYTKKMFGDFMTLPPGMAIEFEELPEKDAQTLKRFIEDTLAGDLMENQDEPMIER
jgi:CheY-like chemotaxis protein